MTSSLKRTCGVCSLDERWKPSRSRLVLTTSEDGIEVDCDPGCPNAWRKEPYAGDIRAWTAKGERNDMTVVVIAGQRMILVTPVREFDFASVGPDERIVRELEGTKVVGTVVVKEDEISRCQLLSIRSADIEMSGDFA
nr:hypothetical protein [Bradyrhizobium diazoefficiens]